MGLCQSEMHKSEAGDAQALVQMSFLEKQKLSAGEADLRILGPKITPRLICFPRIVFITFL